MVELLVFIFLVVVFIAFLLSRNYASDEFAVNTYLNSYASDHEYSDVPPKPTRKKKSVSFNDVVVERVFGDNGHVKSDKLIAING